MVLCLTELLTTNVAILSKQAEPESGRYVHIYKTMSVPVRKLLTIGGTRPQQPNKSSVMGEER